MGVGGGGRGVGGMDALTKGIVFTRHQFTRESMWGKGGMGGMGGDALIIFSPHLFPPIIIYQIKYKLCCH